MLPCSFRSMYMTSSPAARLSCSSLSSKLTTSASARRDRKAAQQCRGRRATALHGTAVRRDRHDTQWLRHDTVATRNGCETRPPRHAMAVRRDRRDTRPLRHETAAARHNCGTRRLREAAAATRGGTWRGRTAWVAEVLILHLCEHTPTHLHHHLALTDRRRAAHAPSARCRDGEGLEASVRHLPEGGPEAPELVSEEEAIRMVRCDAVRTREEEPGMVLRTREEEPGMVRRDAVRGARDGAVRAVRAAR
jgi:hypothetical protein